MQDVEMNGGWRRLTELAALGEWDVATSLVEEMVTDSGTQGVLLLARALVRLGGHDESGALADLCGLAHAELVPSQMEEVGRLLAAVPHSRDDLSDLAHTVLRPHAVARLQSLFDTAKDTPVPNQRASLMRRWEIVKSEWIRLCEREQWSEAVAGCTTYLADIRAALPAAGSDSDELSTLQDAVEALRTSMLVDQAVSLIRQGAVVLAFVVAKQAAESVGPRHREGQIFDVRIVAARAAIGLGELEAAMDFIEDAERLVRHRGQQTQVGELLADLADIAEGMQKLGVAETAYQRAAVLFETGSQDDETLHALAGAMRLASMRVKERRSTLRYETPASPPGQQDGDKTTGGVV